MASDASPDVAASLPATPRGAPKATLTAFLTLLIALLAVSFAPIFIRLGETNLGANATVFNRLLIFIICFGTGRLVSRQLATPSAEAAEAAPPTTQEWLLLGVVGLVSVISLVLWAIALEYTSVAKCMLLNNLTPIFTSLGSWLCFGKVFDRRFLVGMSIALAGAVFLGLEDLAGTTDFLVGDIYAIASAIFLGAYFLIAERLRDRFSATTILLWRCAIGAVLLLPVVLVQESQVFPSTPLAWLAVLGLGLVSEGLGQRLLADSMAKFSSSFIALFLLLEPIVSAILAWMIFTEALSIATWIGFSVILMGIYLAQSSQATAHA